MNAAKRFRSRLARASYANARARRAHLAGNRLAFRYFSIDHDLRLRFRVARMAPLPGCGKVAA